MNGPLRQNRRSEEHTSELQSLTNLVCRLLLEKTNARQPPPHIGENAPLHARSADAIQKQQGRRSEHRDVIDTMIYFFLINRGPPELPPFPLQAAPRT